MIWDFAIDGVPKAPFPVFRLAEFWACETPDGLLALAGKLPWGQLPPFFTELPHARIRYTAFTGWSGDLWYDGPQFYVADGAVLSGVLPGSSAELPLAGKADADGFANWLVRQEVLAWKKSLAQGFRTRLSLEQGAYRLEGLRASPAHMLVLLGLRLAFPNSIFFALDYPSDLKPQWKRYCQNLNLSTWAAPIQLQGLPILDIDALSCFWPAPAASVFLQKLNTRIPIVPGKLAARFICS
jgi:hypothetical protein